MDALEDQVAALELFKALFETVELFEAVGLRKGAEVVDSNVRGGWSGSWVVARLRFRFRFGCETI